jgi:tRNA (guanine10-N2)-methyltransferase
MSGDKTPREFAAASPSSQTQEKENLFIFWFAENQLNFALSELLAVTEYLGLHFAVRPWSTEIEYHQALQPAAQEAARLYSEGSDNDRVHVPPPEWAFPFVLVHVPAGENAVKAICQRSISIKAVWELWGEATTYEAVRHQAEQPSRRAVWQRYQEDTSVSWKVDFLNFQWSLTPEQREERIKSISYLGFPGPIKMRDADLLIGLAEIYDRTAEKLSSHNRSQKEAVLKPELIFMGRKLDVKFGRDLVDLFNVKKRTYIGNTTMESEMSLRMALMGMVRTICDSAFQRLHALNTISLFSGGSREARD